jgi:hypothetical protein
MRKRTNSDRGHLLENVIEVVYNSQSDPEELVALLEITVEDIVERFGDRLEEHCEKFGVYNYWDDIMVSSDEYNQVEHEVLYYQEDIKEQQDQD